jgi:hypothetical protein
VAGPVSSSPAQALTQFVLNYFADLTCRTGFAFVSRGEFEIALVNSSHRDASHGRGTNLGANPFHAVHSTNFWPTQFM